MEKKLYFALDVNEKYITLLAVDIDKDSNRNVVAWTKVQTKGYKTFDVINSELFTDQLKRLINKFENEHYIKVGKVAINIDTNMPTFSIRTKTKKFDSEKLIDKNDISQALDELKELLTNNIKTAFCVLPLSYRVDLESVSSPLNQIGTNIEVKALVISTNSEELYKYLLCIENAGIEILEIAPSFISNIFESFELEDNRKRSIILDFNYKNSKIVFYDSGLLTNYHYLDFGVDNIKEELMSSMNISAKSVDTLFELVYKNKNETLDQVVTLEINSELQEINIVEIKRELNKILKQTLLYIKDKIDSLVSDYSILIITSILADFENIVEISQKVFKRETKVVINDMTVFDNSSWTSSLGIINYMQYVESIYNILIPETKVYKSEYDKINIEYVDIKATQELELREKDNNDQYQEIIIEEKSNNKVSWFSKMKNKLFDNKIGENDDE